MATISWAEILLSTKPGPLVKVGEAAEVGAAVAASAGVVAEDEEAAAVAVAAVAEAGTVTAAIGEAAETAAGNRALQLKNLNPETGSTPQGAPRFLCLRPRPRKHAYELSAMHE